VEEIFDLIPDVPANASVLEQLYVDLADEDVELILVLDRAQISLTMRATETEESASKDALTVDITPVFQSGFTCAKSKQDPTTAEEELALANASFPA